MAIKTGVFMSLDTCIDADDNWQFRWFDDEMFATISSAMSSAGAVLIGAGSFAGYERLVTEFPDSPMVAFLSATPIQVISASRTSSVAYPTAEFRPSASADEVASLASEVDGDLLVLGSPKLLISMLESGALETVNVTVLPIVVGNGPYLFETATRRLTFDPVSVQTMRNGAIAMDLRLID